MRQELNSRRCSLMQSVQVYLRSNDSLRKNTSQIASVAGWQLVNYRYRTLQCWFTAECSKGCVALDHPFTSLVGDSSSKNNPEVAYWGSTREDLRPHWSYLSRLSFGLYPGLEPSPERGYTQLSTMPYQTIQKDFNFPPYFCLRHNTKVVRHFTFYR